MTSSDADVVQDAGNKLAYMLALSGRNLDEAEKLATDAVAAGGEDLATRLDTLGWVLHQ